MRRIFTITCVAGALLLIAAGCGGAEDDDASSTDESITAADGSALSQIPPPTLPEPQKKPVEPTDRVPTGVIVGRIVRGGSGPCYGLEADDGRVYAIYRGSGVTLEEGSYARVSFEPPGRAIDCGEGEPVAAVEITKL